MMNSVIPIANAPKVRHNNDSGNLSFCGDDSCMGCAVKFMLSLLHLADLYLSQAYHQRQGGGTDLKPYLKLQSLG
ncbi:hypothetical protein D3C72_843950 [compost metagenome]